MFPVRPQQTLCLKGCAMIIKLQILAETNCLVPGCGTPGHWCSLQCEFYEALGQVHLQHAGVFLHQSYLRQLKELPGLSNPREQLTRLTQSQDCPSSVVQRCTSDPEQANRKRHASQASCSSLHSSSRRQGKQEGWEVDPLFWEKHEVDFQ